MLDDHILKAQTMHSSAYIKPFEEEMKDWEDKLISMQVSLIFKTLSGLNINTTQKVTWRLLQ
jgi:Dynein heavy chain, N-terminal region 2